VAEDCRASARPLILRVEGTAKLGATPRVPKRFADAVVSFKTRLPEPSAWENNRGTVEYAAIEEKV
jgi:hypothetical protein